MAAKKTPSRSEFVLSLPTSMLPNEVAQKAAEAGFPLTVKAVNAIRNLAKANLGRKAARARGGAAKAKPGGTRGPVNKSAFVRGLPDTLSAKEVVARAKAAGIAITENHVGTIRSLARTAAKKKSSSSASATTATRPSTPTPTPTSPVAKRGPGRPKGSTNRPSVVVVATATTAAASFEATLAELVLDHGIRRVEEALHTVRERLASALR